MVPAVLLTFLALAGPKPTHADVSYGPSPRQRLDIYLPPNGPGPYPVVLWFGGIWKPSKHPARLDYFGKAGCAVVAYFLDNGDVKPVMARLRRLGRRSAE